MGRKVKVSDIKSKSPNVKQLFKVSIGQRRIDFLRSLTFSNDELVEIFELSEHIESHAGRFYFYSLLIKSQEGPFNDAVFSRFVNGLSREETLIKLLENTPNLSFSNKEKFLFYYPQVVGVKSLINLIESNKLKDNKIDVYDDELVFKMLDGLVRASIDSTFVVGKEFLNHVLRTQQNDKIFEWFKENVSGYLHLVSRFLKYYEDATPEMFSHAFDQFSIKEKQHFADGCGDKFPDSLKNELYNLTNDEKYLPTGIRDLFLF